MPSAVLFLPCHIMELTNFVTRSDPYTGSGSTVRLAIYPFRGISASSSWLLTVSSQLPALSPTFRSKSSNFLLDRTLHCFGQRPTSLLCLGPLGPVLRTALLAAGDAHCVEGAANHVIAHTGKILHPAAANQHDRVLLQIVANAGNVGGDFDSIGQADASDFPQG